MTQAEVPEEARTYKHLGSVDELGFVPLSKTGAELLVRGGSANATSGAFWSPPICPSTNGRVRLRAPQPGALLDRLTHHVNILEMNGDSYGSTRAAGVKPRLLTADHPAHA